MAFIFSDFIEAAEDNIQQLRRISRSRAKFTEREDAILYDSRKNDSVKNPDKKKDIEKLSDPIPNNLFDQLVPFGKPITDYQDVNNAVNDAANDGKDLDDDMGVAFEFDENDEKKERDLDMVQEDEDVVEPHGSGAMQMGGGIDDDGSLDADEGTSLNVQDIDAYWLQRKISLAFDQQIDPQQCQKLGEEVLKILVEGDDREFENKLLHHLQFEEVQPH